MKQLSVWILTCISVVAAQGCSVQETIADDGEEANIESTALELKTGSPSAMCRQALEDRCVKPAKIAKDKLETAREEAITKAKATCSAKPKKEAEKCIREAREQIGARTEKAIKKLEQSLRSCAEKVKNECTGDDEQGL